MSGVWPGRFVWADDLCVAFATIEPTSPGHVLVVPRRPYEAWTDAPSDVAAHLMTVARTIAPARHRGSRRDGCAAVEGCPRLRGGTRLRDERPARRVARRRARRTRAALDEFRRAGVTAARTLGRRGRGRAQPPATLPWHRRGNALVPDDDLRGLDGVKEHALSIGEGDRDPRVRSPDNHNPRPGDQAAALPGAQGTRVAVR